MRLVLAKRDTLGILPTAGEKIFIDAGQFELIRKDYPLLFIAQRHPSQTVTVQVATDKRMGEWELICLLKKANQ